MSRQKTIVLMGDQHHIEDLISPSMPVPQERGSRVPHSSAFPLPAIRVFNEEYHVYKELSRGWSKWMDGNSG